jgi:hypothetical protein
MAWTKIGENSGKWSRVKVPKSEAPILPQIYSTYSNIWNNSEEFGAFVAMEYFFLLDILLSLTQYPESANASAFLMEFDIIGSLRTQRQYPEPVNGILILESFEIRTVVLQFNQYKQDIVDTTIVLNLFEIVNV